MSQYRVHIESTRHNLEWIRQFISDLEKNGVPTEGILYFGRPEETLPCTKAEKDYQEAEQQNEEIPYSSRLEEPFPRPLEEIAYVEAQQQNFICTLHLVLHPKHHQWYLQDVIRLLRALEKDRTAILVYDLRELPEDSSSDFPNQQEVSMLLKLLGELCGEKRLLSRHEAINYLKNTIFLPLDTHA